MTKADWTKNIINRVLVDVDEEKVLKTTLS